MPYRLYIKDSGKLLGEVTRAQLDLLTELLEEEDSEDHDYYIDRDILDFLEGEGADPTLLALMRPHVTEDDGVEIEWREE